jgi:hypothetical protein
MGTAEGALTAASRRFSESATLLSPVRFAARRHPQ